MIIEFRPNLNEFWVKNGSNVSYNISCDTYDDEIVKLIILMSKKSKLNKVSVLCNKSDNLFKSAITNNNGYLENNINNNTQRYIIDIKDV